MLRFLAGRSTGALALAATLAVPLAMPAWAQHRDDRHGHVDRGGWHDHGGDHGGGGGALVGGALVGLGLGALVGGAIAASQPAYPPPPAVYYAPQPAYVAPPPGAYYGY